MVYGWFGIRIENCSSFLLVADAGAVVCVYGRGGLDREAHCEMLYLRDTGIRHIHLSGLIY